MFRPWLLFFAALTVGTLAGVALWQDPGYLLIAYKTLSIELPLWLGVVFLVLLLFSWGKLIQLLQWLIRWPKEWRMKQRLKQEQKIFSLIEQTFVGLAATDLKKIQGALKALEVFPELHFATNLLSVWLKLSSQIPMEALRNLLQLKPRTEEERFLYHILKVKALLQQKEFFEARKELEPLEASHPKSPVVLLLLKQFALEAEDDILLKKILPRLHRYSGIPFKELEELEAQWAIRQLAAVKEKEFSAVEIVWKQVSRSLRTRSEVALAYAKALIRVGAAPIAEKWIRSQLEQQSDQALIELYAALPLEPQKRLVYLEKRFATGAQQDPALWSALGSIAKQNALWGQALHYYEQALALKPEPFIFWEIAVLNEQLGKQDQAFEHYRKGLEYAARVPR